MIKQALVILLFLICSSVYSQQDTDSIIVEGYDTYAGAWVSCGMVNMSTNVACTSTNTPNALTAYLINVKYFNIIRQRLINTGAGYIANRKNISHYYLIQTY